VKNGKMPRRSFLKQAAGALGAATRVRGWPTLANLRSPKKLRTGKIAHPWGNPLFSHLSRGQLKTISFPLGGVAAGSLGLGGRGQLRDWEIFNRPNKGRQHWHGSTYRRPLNLKSQLRQL
jgi:non-lysosomal glucosylceramidase